MLTPILVAGYGRSGTTAIMQLLLGDPRVAADRLYPFENRYLTYTAKLSRLAGVPSPRPELHAIQMCDFDDLHFGPCRGRPTAKPGECLAVRPRSCSACTGPP